MHLIQQYLEARQELKEVEEKESLLEHQSRAAKIPKNLRPATPEDIVLDNTIWYPSTFDDPFEEDCWKLVEEVYNPADDYKAYLAQDGCRYGLDGAFVEVKDSHDNNS